VYEYDPVIGYRFIPELRARALHEGGGYLMRTNRQGFWSDHDFAQPKKPGTHRILLFGDSFTAGEGVSSGFRYSDCLEEMLPDTEVFNFGLPASGTDLHYLIYQQHAQRIDHDLLIIAVFVENIRRVAARYRKWIGPRGRPVLYAKPYYELVNGELQLHGVPPAKKPIELRELDPAEQQYVAAPARFPKLKTAYKRARSHPLLGRFLSNADIKDHALKVMRYQPIKEYDDPNDRDWLVMRAIIQRWIRDHDKPVVVMPIPLFHHVAGISDPSSYQARLREAAEGAGGRYLDPLDGMSRDSIRECRALFFDDGHLTRLGHRALAQSIAPELRALVEPKTARG
jgi:hypothetical protein